jgi:hypothetical protein
MSESKCVPQCPYCESIPEQEGLRFFNSFHCGTGYYGDEPEKMRQSYQCKDRQITRLQSALEAAERERDNECEKWAKLAENQQTAVRLLDSQLTAATARAEGLEKELDGLRVEGSKLAAVWRARALNERAFGVDAGKAPSCRCSEELAALLPQPKEVSDGK